MANYYGLGRTNYVRVRDRQIFETWLESLSVDVDVYEHKGNGGEILIALSGYRSDDGCLPSWYETEAGEEREDFLQDFVDDHLHPDDVLIYQTAGAEKARYASGGASAFMVGKEPISLHIGEIYDRAAKAFGVDVATITEATY